MPNEIKTLIRNAVAGLLEDIRAIDINDADALEEISEEDTIMVSWNVEIDEDGNVFEITAKWGADECFEFHNTDKPIEFFHSEEAFALLEDLCDTAITNHMDVWRSAG